MWLNIWLSGVVVFSTGGDLTKNDCESLRSWAIANPTQVVEDLDLEGDTTTLNATCDSESRIFEDSENKVDK